MAPNLAQAGHKSQLRFNWREWALLTVLGILAVLTLFPAVWTHYQQIAQAQGVTVLALVLNQVLQTVIFVGLAVAIGLFFAHRAGLGAPIVEAWLAGEQVGAQTRSILKPAIIPGAGLAVAVAVIDLPATSLTVALTPLVVARALVLNGLLGILYGYLYWRRGLEAAMLSHFSSDIVLHFLLPLLG